MVCNASSGAAPYGWYNLVTVIATVKVIALMWPHKPTIRQRQSLGSPQVTPPPSLPDFSVHSLTSVNLSSDGRGIESRRNLRKKFCLATFPIIPNKLTWIWICSIRNWPIVSSDPALISEQSIPIDLNLFYHNWPCNCNLYFSPSIIPHVKTTLIWTTRSINWTSCRLTAGMWW